MGKTKNKKKSARLNPTGVSTIEQITQEKLQTEPFQTPNYPLLNQLVSQDESDREFACMALSNLVFESPRNLEIMLQQGALKNLIQNMCDPSLNVRIAAAGALRNITIAGGESLVEEMVAKDTMTPILSAIQQVSNKFQSPLAEPDDGIEKEKLKSFLIEIMTLVSYLSESSEAATHLFVQSRLVSTVMQFLKQDIYPLELNILAAQFLNVITDENPPCAQQIIQSPESVSLLQNTLTNENNDIYLRTLVASIGFNIRAPENHIFVVKSIFPILKKAIEFDGQNTLLQLEPSFAEVSATQTFELNTEAILANNQKVLHVKQEIEKWRSCMRAQQLALEILTNICSEDVNEDWQEEEAEMPSNSNGGREVTIPEEIIHMILQSGMLNMVLRYCAFQSPKTSQIIESYPTIKLDFYKQVQMSSLACLGNILLVLSIQELGDANFVWNYLCELCAEGISQPDMLDLITSALWSILRKQTNPIAINFTPQQAQGLYFLTSNCQSEEVRAVCVGMMGILGQQPALSSGIKDLGNLLLNSLGDSSPNVVAEALNSIFDVFAETPVNQVVVELNMMQKLQECYQVLREKLAQSKRSMSKDVRIRLEEAELNLGRFIQYKKQQGV